jgi:hypothetical protein
MAEIVPLHPTNVDGARAQAPNRVVLVGQAVIDNACMHLISDSLPAMQADDHAEGLADRIVKAGQLHDAICLYHDLNECLDWLPTLESLRRSGDIGDVFICWLEHGNIRLTAYVKLDTDYQGVLKFQFTKAVNAPSDFKLYSVLKNLRLVAQCPYAKAA